MEVASARMGALATLDREPFRPPSSFRLRVVSISVPE